MSETATMTLTEFLLARIAEDEAAAKTAALGLGELAAFGIEVMGTKVYVPTRVLAECEAKRRIVELHKADEVGLHVCHDALANDIECGELSALASIYADHRDFQEEWRA